MRILILRDDEWLRGEGPATGLLLRSSDSRKCCLGCYLRDVGVSLDLLDSAVTPQEVDLPEQAEWLLNDSGFDSADAVRLMEINDNETTTDAGKIERMTPFFAAHGIQPEFRP